MKKKSPYRNHRPKRIHRTHLYYHPETLQERIAREMMSQIRERTDLAFLTGMLPPDVSPAKTYTVNQVLGDQKLP